MSAVKNKSGTLRVVLLSENSLLVGNALVVGNINRRFSGAPLIRTPLGLLQVSCLVRCPYFRG